MHLSAVLKKIVVWRYILSKAITQITQPFLLAGGCKMPSVLVILKNAIFKRWRKKPLLLTSFLKKDRKSNRRQQSRCGQQIRRLVFASVVISINNDIRPVWQQAPAINVTPLFRVTLQSSPGSFCCAVCIATACHLSCWIISLFILDICPHYFAPLHLTAYAVLMWHVASITPMW